MADRPMGNRPIRPALTDEDLAAALRDLGRSLAIPAVAVGAAGADRPDPARRARLRIERGAPASGRRGRTWTSWLAPAPGRRITRGLVLALVAVAVMAAVAGAIGLGLPGIRIVPATATPVGTATGGPTASSSPGPSTVASPSPSIGGPLGAGLDLGDPIPVASAASAVDIPVSLPATTGVGPPATAWVHDGRLSFVWPAGPSLPATGRPQIGLILTQFRGSIDAAYFQKVIGPGTTLAAVQVAGSGGWWINGAPHDIVFVDADGRPVYDRRSIGDTLIWTRGDVTYRLESGLDRAAAIALAETIR